MKEKDRSATSNDSGRFAVVTSVDKSKPSESERFERLTKALLALPKTEIDEQRGRAKGASR